MNTKVFTSEDGKRVAKVNLDWDFGDFVVSFNDNSREDFYTEYLHEALSVARQHVRNPPKLTQYDDDSCAIRYGGVTVYCSTEAAAQLLSRRLKVSSCP